MWHIGDHNFTHNIIYLTDHQAANGTPILCKLNPTLYRHKPSQLPATDSEHQRQYWYGTSQKLVGLLPVGWSGSVVITSGAEFGDHS